MRRAPLLLVMACVGSASVAQRRDEPSYQPPPPTIVASPLALVIAGFDRDGDMVVSRAEYDSGVAQSFALADTDKNGGISAIELAGWAELALGNRGALPGPFDFDRNGDDSISRDEFVALCNARFVSLDKDRDTALRRSELISFSAAPPLSREERRRARGDEQGPPR